MVKQQDDLKSRLKIMQLLQQNPEMSQRQLAEALGVSLGKTHYLLKAVLEKGLVKASNFRRSDKKLGYLYQLTPHGLNEKLRMTRQYLNLKEAEYQTLKIELSHLRQELSLSQATNTPLSGMEQVESRAINKNDEK